MIAIQNNNKKVTGFLDHIFNNSLHMFIWKYKIMYFALLSVFNGPAVAGLFNKPLRNELIHSFIH